MPEQLYTERHDSVFRVIHWHICEHFTILVPEQSWKHKQNLILENEQVILTHDKMIPSSVDIANKALRPDIPSCSNTKRKKKMALLIEVTVPNDFGWNATEIRKMTKYQDLKNEVKRMWKLKIWNYTSDSWSYRNDEENPCWVFKNHSGEYHYKRAPGGGCQIGSVKILKRALGTRLWERNFTVWFVNHDPLPKNRRWRFWVLGEPPPTSWYPQMEISTNSRSHISVLLHS